MLARKCRRLPRWLTRRQFFQLASPPLEKSHREHRIVECTPQDLFDVVADVAEYRKFLPFCMDSQVIRKHNENVMEADLKIGFKIFTEKYTSRVLMHRPKKIVIKSIDSPTFQRIDSEWKFAEGPQPGTCVVDFKVDFEVASILHAQAIKLFFDDVVRTQLTAFVQRTLRLQKLRKQKPIREKSSKDLQHSPFQSIYRGIEEKMTMGEMNHLRRVFQRHATSENRLEFDGFVEACKSLSRWNSNETDPSCKSLDYVQDGSIPTALFLSLDASNSPKEYLTEEEFVFGICLMVKGTPDEKAEFLFHSIDTNGDGVIDRDELTGAMERRIDVVSKLVPRLLQEQLCQLSTSKTLVEDPLVMKAFNDGIEAMKLVTLDVKNEIPLAVNQIFQQADLDLSDSICLTEWLLAWQCHSEIVEMMTIDGMASMVQWASAVGIEAPEREGESSQLKSVD